MLAARINDANGYSFSGENEIRGSCEDTNEESRNVSNEYQES